MAPISAPGPSTRSTSPMKYHVFLSFRGIDTRKNFTDHLHSALLRRGIVTFKDDEGLERGEVISEKLFHAIEQSLFVIVVLSKNYASSSWCLDELVKIIESKQDLGQTIFPIFYDVDPSDIRYQKRNFATAFEEYEGRFQCDKVQRWRDALTKIANMSGWDVRDKHEATIVEDIVKSVWNKLRHKLPCNFQHLVGDVQSKVDRIISLLKIGLDDKCFIGIWGMGGIGKTTLARVVYDAIQDEFDAACFLENVREDSEKFGFIYLQKKLLSCLGLREPVIMDSHDGVEIIRNFLCHQKVLIILDDVSHKNQLDKLARDEEWFRAGSKIIITTRDVQLLTQYKQFEKYEVRGLHHDESLKFLCQKAFKRDEPEQDYLALSKEVVQYAFGLPLALEVLGSFFRKREKSEWRDTLDKLRQNLQRDILTSLRMSYDGLEDEEYKTLFLDIACFFNRESKFEVTNILKICGLHPLIGIKVLIEKALLSFSHLNSYPGRNTKEHQDMHDRLQKMRRDIFLPIEFYDGLFREASKEYLYMHDLLQEMGKNIVLQESPSDAGRRSRLWSLKDIDLVLKGNKEMGKNIVLQESPSATGRRSRLWSLKDIDLVLKGNKGTKKVQCIVLDVVDFFQANWHPDCFSKMRNLRLLDFRGVLLTNNLNNLPSALKFLRWDYYSLEYLPSIDQLYELESLQLCYRNIKKLGNGILFLDKLRIIDLSGSNNLSETPNFNGTPNLEKLFLNYCENLARVHESLGQLMKLVELRLEDCGNLVTLPSYLEMANLEVFSLGGCSKLKKLPDFGKSMRSLYLFDVRETSITEVPFSIIHLINLKFFDLSYCKRLNAIPKLPPNLIISAGKCPLLGPKSSPEYLYTSLISNKDPVHLLYDDEGHVKNGVPRWLERRAHYWSKGSSGEEVVTITASIHSEDLLGIVVGLLFQCRRPAWRGFSINWEFKEYYHPNKTKRHLADIFLKAGIDSRVYVGFYPFDEEDCRPHPCGVAPNFV